MRLRRSGRDGQAARRGTARRIRSITLALEPMETRHLLSTVRPWTDLQRPKPIAAQASAVRNHLPPPSVFTVPGGIGEVVSVTFTSVRSDSRYRNELGLIEVDDAAGRIGGLRPGARGYAAAALARPSRRVVLARGANEGSSTTLDLPGGTRFVLYLVQDQSSDHLLARNPTGRPFRRPRVLFSVRAANPAHFQHLRRLSGDRYGFEDLTGGGDRDFDDLIFRLAFGPARAVQDRPPVVTLSGPTAGVVTRRNQAVTGFVRDDRGVADLQARISKVEPGGQTILVASSSVPFNAATGAFSFETGLPLDGSGDGTYSIELVARDGAGQASVPASLDFTLDTKAPTLAVIAPTQGSTLTPGSRLIGKAGGTGSGIAAVSYRFDGGAPRTVGVGADGAFDEALAIVGLGSGGHTLTVATTDLAGNVTTTDIGVVLSAETFTLTGFTPLDGADGVGALTHPRINFSRPVSAGSLNATNFLATAGGAPLPASIVVDPLEMYARLFLEGGMPGGAEVTVTVDGSTILAADDGAALDADGDNIAGGVLSSTFTAASKFALPGTTLSGRIADAGPDLIPLTADDTQPGPDGILGTPDDVVLLPLTGVRLRFRGLEGTMITTGADGGFRFDAAPAGSAALTMQGEFAAAPGGLTFPELNADLTLTAGADNPLGTIYMPRLAVAVVQDVDASVDTTLTLPAEGAPGLTEAQRQLFTLQLEAGTLLGPDGQAVANAQVVMSLLPNGSIKPFLPPTLPEPVMVFTTQLRGASDIARPFRATFPNLDGARVGDEFLVLSFDQATGKLVPDGTAVAVASAGTRPLAPGAIEGIGDLIVWDPGEEGGLVACFHVLMPRGNGGVSPVESADCDPDVLPTEPVFPVFLDNGSFQDRFFDSDNGSFTLHFENAAAPIDPTLDACNPVNQRATPLIVSVTLEQPEGQPFLDGLDSQTFYLYPQESKDIPVLLRCLLDPDDLDAATASRLYGATIELKGIVLDPKTSAETLVFDQKIQVYRLWDIADDDHLDGTLEFERTLADGQDGVARDKPFELVMSESARPTLTTGGAFAYDAALGRIRFDPTTAGTQGSGLAIVSPGGETAGTILLQGEGLATTNIAFSRASFLAAVALVVDSNNILNPQWSDFRSLFPDDLDDDGLRSDEAGFAVIANAMYDQIVANVEGRFAFDPQVAAAVAVSESGAGVQITSLLNPFPGDNPLAIATSPWVDFDRPGFDQMLDNQGKLSTPQEQFLLASFTNLSPTDPTSRGIQGVALYMGPLAKDLGPDPLTIFTTLVSNTIAHEVGHVLGLIHTRSQEDLYIYGTDVMGSGSPEFLQMFGNPHRGLVKSAVGVPMTQAEFSAAVEYYRTFVNLETFPFSVPALVPGEIEPEPRLLTVYDGPVAFDQPRPNPVSRIDFGTILADGTGGADGTVSLVLFNSGTQELTISGIELQSGGGGFSVEGMGSLPLVIPSLVPGDVQPGLSQRTITLRFDPSTPGSARDVLRIVSDSLGGSSIEIPLSGTGISPSGALVVEAANANLGGVKVGDGEVSVAGMATIRNAGAGALSISSIGLDDGGGQFALIGLPAGLSASNPLVLAAGQSFRFGVSFDATLIGLQRAHVRIVSDDPDRPSVEQTILGTGLADTGSALDYGRDYVAVQPLDVVNAPVLRRISDVGGHWNVYLTAGRPFRHAIFDPTSGLIHQTADMTSTTGATEVLLPVFHASTAPDGDGDGLPDDIEFAIGSSAGDVDSDGDGLDDFAEIALGKDPRDGVASTTGMVGGLAMPGEAWDIAISDSFALVATGDHGLAVVDVSNPIKPILIGAKDLGGFNVSVAVEPTLKLVAVASDQGSPGLHIVSVADPANPQLLRTVPLAAGASHVEVLDGVAYVSSGTAVVAIELVSGDVLQTLNLGGAAITGMARDGRHLYAIDAEGRLSSLDISGFQATVIDTLILEDGAGGELFAGGGVLYAAAKGAFRGGFATVDITDPADLATLSGTDVAAGFRPDRAVAADGSGLALVLGSVPDPQNPLHTIHVTDLASVTDPSDTDAYITRFTLPQFPLGLALASGVAYIADGSAGLLVLGYRSDPGTARPMASLETLTADADLDSPGTQIVAGTHVHLRADVSDDASARRVEFLLDGQVVATDLSFPYEAIVPVGSPGASVSMRARVTDLAGNSALSDALTIQVVADTFAPSILAIDPPDDSTRPEGLQAVRVRFSEAIDSTRVTASNFRLLRDGLIVVPTRVDLLSMGTVVELAFAGLTGGDYQFVIRGGDVTDLSGNPLAAGDVVSYFTLTGDSKDWINPAGGFWDDPGNWEGGTLPGPGDNVLIDVPGDVTITFRTGTVIVNRVTSKGALALVGGELQVNTTIQVDAAFTLGSGATLRGATILPGAGGQQPHVVSSADLDGVTLLSGLTIDDLGTAWIRNGLTLGDARVTLASAGGTTMLFFEGDQTLGGSGEVFFGGSGGGAVAVDGKLTIGPGITLRGDQDGSVGASFASETILLQGTVLAETPGRTIVLGGNGSQIQGLVSATAGTVRLEDTISFAGAGTFHSDGGRVVLAGILDNAGKTLAITAATGSLFADGGTVRGGRVEASGRAALTPEFELRLDGVTLGSDFTVPDGTDVLVSNGLTLDDVDVTLADGSVAFVGARIRFTDSSVLGGTGEVIFGGTGDANTLTGTSSFTWTIGPGIIVHGPRGGTVGVLGNLMNQGTIVADTGGRTLTVGGSSVINEGTISAVDGGRLQFGVAAVNRGLLIVGTSSTVRQISGTLLQDGGETRLDGGTVQAATINIRGGSLTGTGTIDGDLINGGVISFGTDAQLLATIHVRGDFIQQATGVIRTALGGTSTDQYGRLAIDGAATLAGTLDVRLVSGYTPAAGSLYDVLVYGSLNGVFGSLTGLDGGVVELVAEQTPTRVRLTAV